jgi:hypothetical protein
VSEESDVRVFWLPMMLTALSLDISPSDGINEKCNSIWKYLSVGRGQQSAVRAPGEKTAGNMSGAT